MFYENFKKIYKDFKLQNSMKKEVHHKIELYIRKSISKGIPIEKIIGKLSELGVSQETTKEMLHHLELEKYFLLHTEKLTEEKAKLERIHQELGKGHALMVRDFMSSPIISIEKHQPLSSAIKLMDERDIGSLVITEHQIPVGIITERDLLKKVLAHNLTAQQIAIADIMSSPLITGEVTEKLLEVETKMKLNNIRRMPLLENDKLVGIITSSDIIRIMAFM